MTEELKELIERARNHVWTEAEKREHVINFAWGNVHIHNPAITKEMVEVEYDKIQSEKLIKGST